MVPRIVTTVMRALFALGVASCFLATAIAPSAARAEPLHVAGLIVDYGNGARSFAWVPFAEDEITGIDLLRKSDLPLLTIGFGGLGDGVCKIETTGCDVSACRQRLCQTADRTSPYWQYLRLGSNGTWSTQALGGSGSIVTDGDIDAWVWAAGDSHPALPALTLPEIAMRAGVDPTIRNGAPVSPAPIVRTEGALPVAAAGTASGMDYALAGTVLVALAGAGGLVMLRARRRRSHPS